MPARCSFAGADLVGLPAHRRVRLGIARTFQKIRLFKQLTVLENVLAGFHIHHADPAWQYVVPGAAAGRDRSRCRAEAEELLAFVGLAARAGRARRRAALRPAAHAGDRTLARHAAAPLHARRAGRRPERRRGRVSAAAPGGHRPARHHGGGGRAQHGPRDERRASACSSWTTASISSRDAARSAGQPAGDRGVPRRRVPWLLSESERTWSSPTARCRPAATFPSRWPKARS